MATPDAHLVQFGKGVTDDPTADSDPGDGLALSLALHNFTRNDHVLAQGGQSHFAFRYSTLYAPGPFAAGSALRFAAEAAQPLPATWAIGAADASAAAWCGSFLAVEPAHVMVTGFKVAEKGRGWVLRLWECEGKEAEAAVDMRGMGAGQAWSCDLLERIQAPLPVRDSVVRIAIPARGLRAIRFA